MRFLMRCLLTLGVAVVLGVLLYYAVQAVSDASPQQRQHIGNAPPVASNAAENPATRPARPENNSGGGVRGRSLLQIAKRIVIFSVLVFASVLARNLIFNRKPSQRKPTD